MAEQNPPSLNPALEQFWLTPARNRVLYGGRNSTKSWDAGGFACFLADNYKLRILCVRQFQNKIEESVYALLKVQINRFGLAPRFDIQRNKIYNRRTGSEFMFYGLWRSIDEIKSLEGIDILWIEEAHNLTAEQWETLEATIRKDFSQVWIIFNPKLASDFVYKRFVVNPPPDTVVRHINYTENAFLSDVSRRIIEDKKLNDPEGYQHIYLGVPRENDDSVIIKRSWVMAAIDAHLTLKIDPVGSKRMGFDIADSGLDKCANIYAHGWVALWADLWKAQEDELLKSCTRTYMAARERSASIIYDSIGVGAAAGAKFGEINKVGDDETIRVSYNKFNAGGGVFQPDKIYYEGTKNKDMFSNIKAQAWWLLADRFRNTYNAVTHGQKFNIDQMISISSKISHLELLIDELTTPKRDYDQNGRVQVESKKDLAKRLVPSPNMADALVMAFAPGIVPMKINNSLIARVRR